MPPRSKTKTDACQCMYNHMQHMPQRRHPCPTSEPGVLSLHSNHLSSRRLSSDKVLPPIRQRGKAVNKALWAALDQVGTTSRGRNSLEDLGQLCFRH